MATYLITAFYRPRYNPADPEKPAPEKSMIVGSIECDKTEDIRAMCKTLENLVPRTMLVFEDITSVTSPMAFLEKHLQRLQARTS